MACDTFLKIAQKCRRHFIQIQVGEAVPFIEEILSSINTIICDLNPQQVCLSLPPPTPVSRIASLRSGYDSCDGAVYMLFLSPWHRCTRSTRRLAWWSAHRQSRRRRSTWSRSTWCCPIRSGIRWSARRRPMSRCSKSLRSSNSSQTSWKPTCVPVRVSVIPMSSRYGNYVSIFLWPWDDLGYPIHDVILCSWSWEESISTCWMCTKSCQRISQRPASPTATRS